MSRLDDINTKAEQLKAAGNEQELIKLANEIGLTKEDAEDYFDGVVTEFATYTYLAAATLNKQSKELDLKGAVKDYAQQIEELAANNVTFAENVVEHTGSDLTHCLAQILRFSFNNKVAVPGNIVNVTMVTVNGKEQKMRTPLYLGTPSRADVRRIAEEYYGGGK